MYILCQMQTVARLASLRSTARSGSKAAVLCAVHSQTSSPDTFFSHRFASYGTLVTKSSRNPYPLGKRVVWIHETLHLVQNSGASAKHPLVKEQLWEKCGAEESCTLPSKAVLGESLNWLRKNRYINAGKSDIGTRKNPRFGFFVREDATGAVTEANDELIEKWARHCHREQEGYKRAVMVGHQADQLARALANGRGLHSTDRPAPADDVEDDAWMESDEAASEASEEAITGSKAEQVAARIEKAISHETASLQKCQKEGRVLAHARSLLERMAPLAAHKLTKWHTRDYDAQVQKQLSNLAVRKAELKTEQLRHQTNLDQYVEWQGELSEGSLEGLQQALEKQGQSLSTAFPEASWRPPRHLLEAEIPAAKDAAVRHAQDAVAKAKWSAAKTEKVGERMVKVARSADERAYADRVLQQSVKDSEVIVQRAEKNLAQTKRSPPKAYRDVAARNAQAQGKAWYREHAASAEMKLRREYVKKQAAKRENTKGPNKKHTKKVVTRGTIRTSGAAVKRVAREHDSFGRLETEVSRRRWSRGGSCYVDTTDVWGRLQ